MPPVNHAVGDLAGSHLQELDRDTFRIANVAHAPAPVGTSVDIDDLARELETITACRRDGRVRIVDVEAYMRRTGIAQSAAHHRTIGRSGIADQLDALTGRLDERDLQRCARNASHPLDQSVIARTSRQQLETKPIDEERDHAVEITDGEARVIEAPDRYRGSGRRSRLHRCIHAGWSKNLLGLRKNDSTTAPSFDPATWRLPAGRQT